MKAKEVSKFPKHLKRTTVMKGTFKSSKHLKNWFNYFLMCKQAGTVGVICRFETEEFVEG